MALMVCPAAVNSAGFSFSKNRKQIAAWKTCSLNVDIPHNSLANDDVQPRPGKRIEYQTSNQRTANKQPTASAPNSIRPNRNMRQVFRQQAVIARQFSAV
jgi:hypothetical protein